VKIFICGMGLLGTSLALALRGRGIKTAGCEINPDYRTVLQGMGFTEIYNPESSSLSEMLNGVDGVVFATPVDSILPLTREIASNFPNPGFWLTDMASTKSALVESIATELPGYPFIGSHPMAGSDLSGPDHALDDLFENATIYVTPYSEYASVYPAYQTALTAVMAFWKQLGAHPTEISHKVHDTWAAYLSHGLHLVSCMVAHLLKDVPEVFELPVKPAAGSFRDITRVAGSNPVLWDGIIRSNREEVVHYLLSLETIAKDWREQMEKGTFNIERTFTEASEIRKKIVEKQV